MRCRETVFLLGLGTTQSRFTEAAKAQPLTLGFIGLALATRAIFWAYTGRIWEDAIISSSPARNVWEGAGLTHHISEPRVHSFTSALGELVLIAGEGFGAGYGITAMRIVSLLAAVAAIVYAARICGALRLHWSAQVLLLGYLATDHLHVFFGMAGMETQLAVAIALANAWYFLERRWVLLGIATGLAIICRPELLLWPAILGLALALNWWRTRRIAPILAWVVPAALTALPWFVFATLYYGSPIPHTIVVKSFIARIVAANVRVSAYAAESWSHIAPLREYVGFAVVPVPDSLLKSVVAIVLALALAGAFHAVRLDKRMLAIVAVVAGFFLYRTLARVTPYFMWYLPPFTALLFLFVACGVSWVAQRQKAIAAVTGCALFLIYAMHLPLTLPLDKVMQQEIEEGVRLPVGEKLQALMGNRDTVLLEPLGFIGWAAKNKTTYDFPGLSSPIAFAAFRRHVSMAGMIADLSPTHLALRPHEWEGIEKSAPELAARYEAVTTVQARPGLMLALGGARYHSGDAVFTIYRLRQR